MHSRHSIVALAALAAVLGGAAAAAQDREDFAARLDRLGAEVRRAEDVSAIKRLQRIYGYYVDKGMWADLAELFTDDAVANYPAGVYVGKPSIARHLFMNVGGGRMGDIGLGDGRLYNHMNIQPVVHLDPGGMAAKGRWRALAMFGNLGGGAVWAEGVYEMTYAKQDGVWKIATLDYHSGFGAPYATGWVDPGGPRRARGARNLPYPADRERNEACAGFPDACLAPFHYTNPGTTDDGHVWRDEPPAAASERARGDRADPARLTDLAGRAARLEDEQAIENLQRTYGYYLDQALWDDIAALFTDDGTIEMGLQGVYVGPERIREFLGLLGPEGGRDGWLNDHVQLQIVVTVAPDGRSAKLRSRELDMTGTHGGTGYWSEGIYENTLVKQSGVWKFESLRFYPTFITDYDKGWAEDAEPPPAASTTLPPDRPPTDVYEIYPHAHIPPYHYPNPVTGEPPQYPREQGRPSADAIRRATAPVAASELERRRGALGADELEAALDAAERRIARVKDYDEVENLESAYGYYLDKNLWNDLADLFSRDGSIELAQRGVYKGQDHVRQFLLTVFGRGSEGPVEGRLGNHLQLQPVIHVAPDGRTAKIRSRVIQQLSFGERASLGAGIYENEAVKEDGVWKLSVDHAYNTWTAAYSEGWMRTEGRYIPGPSRDYPPDTPPTFEFSMFPNVYAIPFHYRNPVTGRPATTDRRDEARRDLAEPSIAPGEPRGMPADIAAELAAIGARIETQATGARYAALQPQAPYAGVRLERDLRYGPAEGNVLDIFTAPSQSAAEAGGARAGVGAGRPVVVFVHGGGFSRGAKHVEGSPFYDNIGVWAVAHGLVGVTINYRLAPESVWPSGIEDVGAVVAWLHEHIADYGGDPDRIVLWGHSAGAAHVGDYVANATLRGSGAKVAGAVLTSGFYDLGDEVSVWKDYYGEDVATYPERSSLAGLVRTSTPLLINDAELDPEMFREQTRRLAAARAEVGRPVRYVHLLGHSHISETYAVGTADESLSGPVLEFIDRVAR